MNNINDWLAMDRSETDTHRFETKVLDNGIVVHNAALGINIYKNAITKEDGARYINTLETCLSKNIPPFVWQGAKVTESEKVLTMARNCVDFKIRKNAYFPSTDEQKAVVDMHEEAFQKIKQSMDHYSVSWGFGVNFYESFNFVKYDGAGTHFKIHADHGPGYVSTVSVVAYLNDDYEGGEIYFPRFNLTIKPEAGDIVIFPSTYIYEHASQDMISGTKYCIVVMTDYNDRGGLRSHPYAQQPAQLVY